MLIGRSSHCPHRRRDLGCGNQHRRGLVRRRRLDSWSPIILEMGVRRGSLQQGRLPGPLEA